MRRTARALSVAVLAGVVLGGGASAAFADPSAEVSPGTAQPGGDVSVSVSCDPVGQGAPETLEATSQAFDQGSVRLTHVPAADDDVSGPEYRGTARLAATAADAAGDTGPVTAPGAGAEADTVGPDTVPEPTGLDPTGADVAVPDPTGTDRAAPDAAGTGRGAPDAAGGAPAWTVGGTCPAAPGEQGQPWNTTFTVARGDHHADAGEAGVTGASCPKPRPKAGADAAVPAPTWTPDPGHGSCVPTPVPVPVPPTAPDHRSSSTPAPVQRGVEAGGGGAFTPSVPALATGAALIAAALGGAVYRLRGKGVRRNG